MAEFYFWLAILTSLINFSKLDQPSHCPFVPKLNVVPGFGWDALTNRDTKQLMQSTYDECKLTPDGKWMIPDNTVAVEVEEIRIVAEVFEHWSNYTAPTADSFRVSSEETKRFLPLFYSFSDEYQEMKTLQVKHEAATCRSQLRQLLYRIHTTPQSFLLDSVKERFLQVISAVSRNFTDHAKYLIEMIVSDYGTHYERSVDVGAVCVKEDYLRNTFLKANSKQMGKIMSAAKLSLVSHVGFPWKDKEQMDSSLLSDYSAAVMEEKERYFGEPDWEKRLTSEKMVTIDRSGDLLTGVVTSVNFPNASRSVLSEIKEMLEDVIHEYFERNIHEGCTQLKSSNFDFIANLDNGSCNSPVANYLFGGLYQNCWSRTATYATSSYCPAYQYYNRLSSGYSCPSNFDDSIIFSQWHEITTYHFFRIALGSCIANYSASITESYMFGGVYSPQVDNIHTKSKACPPFYTSQMMPNGYLTVCVNTTNNESAQNYALPFGGFTNSSLESRCPLGYKKHFAASYSSEQETGYTYDSPFITENIYYCLQEPNRKNFGVMPVLIRPPFDKAPDMILTDISDEEYDDYGIRVVVTATQTSLATCVNVEYLLFIITFAVIAKI